MKRVKDKYGNTLEIEDQLWDSLERSGRNNYSLADITPPKEVVEFKPTQKTKVEQFIDEKKCCKENGCENNPVIDKVDEHENNPVIEPVKEVTKPKNKGGRPKK